MTTLRISAAITLLLATAATEAAGPLRLTEGTDPEPLKWDMSNGPIPVYTDGGDAFTFDFDGVTPFISIARANEVTEFAFQQWSNVATSTFAAEVAGSIEAQVGIADVTIDNADQIYFTENGHGFWVVYDTDGTILSDLFGVPPTSVLGIAFPEFADENGNITEATALMNGFAVNVNDPNLDQFAGVFTHEFGHAINLAHTQTNGHIAYFNFPFNPQQPGVRGCQTFPALTDFEYIETMYPFINSSGSAGTAQSTVNHPDDVAAISDIYPTADYHSSRGSISGTLYLKDGKTEYSGINIVARNVADLYGDAVSGLSGDLTQGQVGPDGSYTLNNLTPGADYVLYIERIVNGAFSTPARPMVSQSEYWNSQESNDPAVDEACSFSTITAEAGVSKTADITFNGYLKGIQYTPVVNAFLTDLSKNGNRSAGFLGSTAFVWDEKQGFSVLPPEIVANNGSMTRNGQKMTVQFDADGDGIQQAALFDFQGSKKGEVISLGDLNGDTCGGSSSNGVNSSSGWAVDDAGKTAVGLAYIDQDGNGSCQQSFAGEIVPFVWDKKDGMRELDTSGLPSTPQFVRAHAISGDGSVILGTAGSTNAVAWVNEGAMINLRDELGATDAYASSYDGTRIAVRTQSDGVELWNAHTGEHENIGGLQWCVDKDFIHFFLGNLCTHPAFGPGAVQDLFGPIPVLPSDMNDDGSVIIGRAGTFFTGLLGAIWIEDIGWVGLDRFFREQGVAELFDLPLDNPLSIDGAGKTFVGGYAGSIFSGIVNMEQVYVCQDGNSIQTGFPNGLRAKISEGAQLGRCEFIDD